MVARVVPNALSGAVRGLTLSALGTTRATIFLIAVAGAQERVADPHTYLTYDGFTIAEKAVLPAREIHPSLWFRAEDEARLRDRIKTDEFSKVRWQAILRLARLDAPVPAAPAAPVPLTRLDESIHRYYGQVSIAARAQALVACLATDPGERAAHLARAKALLLRAYDGPIFQLDSRVTSSPVDEIYRGTWLQNYAHAYDLIQPELTAAENTLIRARLALEAECVYENVFSWTPRSPHNHLSKPGWGLGSMALTMSDDPRAKAWLGRALDTSNRNTRYFFAADGLYREGSHYDIFSLINYLPFLYHYRNVSGVDDFPVFQPAFEYMVRVRNSRGWMPNIEDSYLKPTPTHLAAAAYKHSHTQLHSLAPLSEVLQWSYDTADLTAFGAEEGKEALNYTGATLDYPLEIDEFLTRDPSIRDTPPNCYPAQFMPSGQTVLRTDWTVKGKGERYLLFHGVAEADNHNHHDHLSFIIEAEGQMMASDAGYSAENYHDASRLKWFAAAPAHNTLTFDGGPAVDFAPNNGPHSTFHYAGPGLQLEQKAARFAGIRGAGSSGGGGGANWQRTVALISNDYFMVVDTLQAEREGTVAGYFHGGRGQMAVKDRTATWEYADDRYGAASSLRGFFCAPEAKLAAAEGELTYVKGDHAPFGYVKLESKAKSLAWITILAPRAKGAAADLMVTDRSEGAQTALGLKGPRGSALFVARAVGGEATRLDGLETNAKVAFVQTTLSGEVSGSFAIEGTYLRYEGKTLWEQEATGSVGR